MANFSALKTAIQNAIRQNGNEEITGNLLQQILLSVVNTMGDGAINTIEQNLSNETLARQNADTTLQSNINAEALARGNADTQLQNAINAIKANIDNGYVYAGIATPSSTPVSGKVFYIATAAGTYTNFGGQVLTQGINILRFNGSAWSSQQLIGIDDAPTAGSDNLVKSGGVQNELALGAVYDVSAKNPTAGPNNDGKWESLSALLSDANLNTLIPTAYRKGGMSIKFVQSSDNTYVQCRLMANEFTTDTTQWAIADEGVYLENPEFVYVKTDDKGKILLAIKIDGSIYYGAGCPQQVRDYIREKSAEIYAQIATKLDAEGLDSDALKSVQIIESPEFVEVELDADDKVLSGRNIDGTKVENCPVRFSKIFINGKNLEEELDKFVVKDDSVYAINPEIHRAIVAATSAKYNYPENPNKAMPSFLIMTDIHADWNCFERGLKYADDEDYINEVIVLGDICSSGEQLRNYDYIDKTNACSKPVLSVAGNHEMVIGDSPLTQAELMSTLYTDQAILHNGETHPNGKPWWYKDISHSYTKGDGSRVTNTVRIIGLFQYCYNEVTEKNEWYISQEEINWFIDVLENTPQDAYILILMHGLLEDKSNISHVDSKFTANHTYLLNNKSVFTDASFLTNIIRAWINGVNITASTTSVSGNIPISVNHTFAAHPNKPVCFLTGHLHRDEIYRINGNEPIYYVVLHCTSSALTRQFGDLGREQTDGMKDKDCLTVFVFDYIYNRIKLIRVGADVTIDMKKRDFDTIELV